MNRYLFLDIDGVLSPEQTVYTNRHHGTEWTCVQRLNQIIAATDAFVVVSSSWRKVVLQGDMTLDGFERSLLRHGLDIEGRLIDITEADGCAQSRGELISRWLRSHAVKPYKYVILDDGSPWISWRIDHGFVEAGHHECWIRVNGHTGLVDRDMFQAIELLNGKVMTPRALKRVCVDHETNRYHYWE